MNMKNTRFKIPQIWERTGIYAVDLVMACIEHNRFFRKPLQNIWLKKNLYWEFAAFVSFKDKKNIEANGIEIGPDTCILEFDGVNILQGVEFQSQEVIFQMHGNLDMDGLLKKPKVSKKETKPLAFEKSGQQVQAFRGKK